MYIISLSILTVFYLGIFALVPQEAWLWPYFLLSTLASALVKSALGMSQGTLNTVLAGIAAITGMISIVIAVRHNRQRTKEQEKDRRLVMEQKRLIEQQLELSRDQASSLPLIELMEFSVHPLEENQELFQEVSCAQQAMVALQEKRAEDERRAGPCRA